MPLKAHLIELRNRLFVAAIAVVACAVVGWYLYDVVVAALTAPLDTINADPGTDREAALNYQGPTTAFDIQVKVSLWLGVMLASPVWIYQLWAFVTPGLTRRERWYAVAFMAAAVPLFLGGALLAWFVLPNAIVFLTGFTPEGQVNFIPADLYFSFVTRVLLAFGVAFLVPVVMVALNLAGLASARQLVKGWRVAIVICFVFAAIASPTPDITTMFALAGPMVLLYFGAVGIAAFSDWRRHRRAAAAGLSDLADDEAAPLEPASGPVAAPEAIEPGSDPLAPLETAGPMGSGQELGRLHAAAERDIT